MVTKELLARFEVFRSLTTRQLEQLEAIAQVRDYADGEVLFREGEVAGYLDLLESGRVALQMTLPNDRRVQVYTVEAGGGLGWSALAENTQYTASARAVGPVRTIRIPRDRLASLFDQDPHMGMVVYRGLLGVVAQRLAEARVRIASMACD
jgi:CRP/FNR family cyclic AMP-dependent transcriptional regulator